VAADCAGELAEDGAEGCGDPAQADSNKAEAARAASVDLGYSKLIPGFFHQGASNRTQAWRACVTLPS